MYKAFFLTVQILVASRAAVKNRNQDRNRYLSGTAAIGQASPPFRIDRIARNGKKSQVTRER